MVHGFPDPASEIYFFKHVKPVVVGRCKYYQRICQLQLGPWKETSAWSTERLAKEMTMVEQVFEQNSSLWQYYRSGSTDWDEQYFMRRQHQWLWLPGQEAADNLFSTPCDGKLADLLAMELYSGYIGRRMAGDEDHIVAARQPEAGNVIVSPGTVTDLTVIGYALYEANLYPREYAGRVIPGTGRFL